MLDKLPHLAGNGDLRHHHLQSIVHAAVITHLTAVLMR
jgi:hypothetical protein